MKIYIIIEANAYDGYYPPDDFYYIDKAAADKECERLNIAQSGNNKKHWYFSVQELEPAK